jgi:hypothetical protein
LHSGRGPARQSTNPRKKAHSPRRKAHSLRMKAPAAAPRCRATGRVNGLAEVETSKQFCAVTLTQVACGHTVGQERREPLGVSTVIHMRCGCARWRTGVRRCRRAGTRYLHNDETCMFARLGTRRTSLESGYDGNRMANAMRSGRTYGMACTVPMRPGEGNTFCPPCGGARGPYARGPLGGTYRGSSHTHQTRILLSSGGEGHAKANE